MINAKATSIRAFVALVVILVVMLQQRILLADGIPGLAVQGAAVLLMLWARLAFGRRSFHAAADPTEGGLVTTGPYRFLRHPIYAAILYFTWAGALTHVSVTSILLGVAATVAAAVRIGTEEHLVIRRYPEYAEYAQRTKRVIPYIF